MPPLRSTPRQRDAHRNQYVACRCRSIHEGSRAVQARGRRQEAMTTNKNCAHHRYPQDCDPSCAEIQRLRTDLAAANASTPSESRRTYTLSDDGLRKLIAAMGRLGPTISAGIVADLIDTRAAEIGRAS